MNERLVLESANTAANVRFWVFAVAKLPDGSHPIPDVRAAIRALDSGHSLNVTFPGFPSPTGHLGKSNREQISGTGAPRTAPDVIPDCWHDHGVSLGSMAF
jgi:hypothetical protein